MSDQFNINIITSTACPICFSKLELYHSDYTSIIDCFYIKSFLYKKFIIKTETANDAYFSLNKSNNPASIATKYSFKPSRFPNKRILLKNKLVKRKTTQSNDNIKYYALYCGNSNCYYYKYVSDLMKEKT